MNNSDTPNGWTRSFVVAVAVLASFAANAALAFELRMPVDCTLGSDCFVQNFVDTDPSPKWRDHACGTRTYDGHKGTDFRIRDLRIMREGVAVLAAAAGHVTRFRDGERDREIGEDPATADPARACGNGIVIEHDGGWSTQYCHLRNGSVRVRPGDRVEAGTPVGLVGLSGKTEFPHLHVTVRRGRDVIDPVTGLKTDADCGVAGKSIFDAKTATAIEAQGVTVLNSGFSDGRVTMKAIEGGTASAEITRQSAALVFFARAIWLKAGDRPVIDVFAPSGRPLVSSPPKPVNRDKAQWMSFAGRKRPEGGWPPGLYRARYRILREGSAVIDVSTDIEIK